MHTSPIRNVTPITDCISHLKQSASPVGDAFHFFESIDAKDELIRFYRQKTDTGFLFMIRHPNDLDHHPLRRLHYYPTPGQKNERPGLIYQSVPITLIFDCDNLRPRQLASLNELLENPPRLDGIPISTTVSRVVLAKNDLIYQPDAPGPDFWRRIFAQDRSSSATFNVTPAAVPSWSVSHRTEPPEPGSLLIHCAGQDVFASLFGNLAINSHGEQYFRNGVISSQPDPVTICLVDPPDAKSPFWQHLSDILKQGYFIANGERVELPASLVLQQYHTPTENITAFKQAVNNTPVLPGKTCGVINTHNFDAVFSDLSAQENTLQKTDTFHKMASEFDQLLVSGELTDEQWLILKHRTESLPVAPGLVTGTLPEPSGNSVVRLYTGSVANNVAAHCYRLASGQQWEELWFTSKLKLSGKLSFQLRETPLLTQLLKGKPVVLSGLEHTPTLAGHLESLLAPEPYLWIYGQKKALPNCQLHIVWPPDRLPDQGPWFQRWQQQQDTRSDRSAGSVEADSVEPDSVEPETAELGKAESILAESIMAAPGLIKPFSSHHPDAIGPLGRLLSRIRTLPQSPDKSYPVIPLQAPAEFLKLLEAQLPIEQRLDRAGTLEPFHWRKALNKLLAHPVRGNVTIYSFVKAQISGIFPDSMAEVDRDGIAAILNTLPALEHPKDLTDHFWPLARYMAPALGEYLPATFGKPSLRCTAKMAAIIHSIFPQQGIEADLLPVLDDNIHPYSGHRLRLLYNALRVCGSQSIPVHRQARDLNQQLIAISQCHPSEPLEQLQQPLQRAFSEPLLTTSLQTLAADWLKASCHHQQQQGKRLEQLTTMLRQHRIIELNGPAGTGKSCLAVATGQALQERRQASMNRLAAGPQPDQHTVKTLTLGPNTTWEDLYGSVSLKRDRQGNTVSHLVPGQITDWARRKRPGLLVINEANLVQPGLLSPLTGLLQSPPRLCVNGQTFELTDNHRVLLTGNPENYPGRNLDPELQRRILRLYYRPLPESILQQAIIEPLLPDTWPMELRSTTSDTILSLLAEYRKQVSTDYELTPRDLKDIMARFRLITADAPCPTSQAQVLALADEACGQSLGGRIDRDQRPEWQALRDYRHSSGKVDRSLLDQHQRAFTQFFGQLAQVNKKQSTPLVIDTPATREYIKTCWQFLQLREPGRVAMVVEGTAGWGKDALLLLTLTTWQQQTGKGFQHLNGTPDQFNQFVQAFNRAWRLGEVLVVSELNIIPSGLLEEFLNDRLPLPHKDGFKLIGTVNPPTYPGRTAFPPSLTSRFTGVHIHHDTRDDYRLRLQAMGVSEELSRWLTDCASALNDDFRQQRIPLELTLPQLLLAADRLDRIPMGRWHEGLSWEWQPYLKNRTSTFQWPYIVVQSSKNGSSRGPATDSPKIFSQGTPHDVCINFQVTRFFPRQWCIDRYRLKLFTADVTTDQTLVKSPLPMDPMDQSNFLPLLTGRTDLKTGETPGRMTLKPGSNWQRLPSLTPNDRLTGLRSIPKHTQLARDTHTDQYFLRSGLTEPVTVDFIIKPDLTYFQPLTADDPINTQPLRCPPLIKVHLDQEVFSGDPTHFPGYRKLREIGQIENLSERLLALVDWFRAFSYDRTFEETGITLVKQLLQEQQGTCRHRGFLFQLLCLYWGIEARIVESFTHSFVEVRSHNGWRLYDLGGTDATHSYSSEPEWHNIFKSAPVEPVNSPYAQDGAADGWNGILSLAVSLLQQHKCTQSELPQEAIKQIQDTVLEKFRKNFRPIPLFRGLLSERSYQVSPNRERYVFEMDIACNWVPEQYLLAARHAIDHFATLAPPEKKAIIDWSHCMLIRSTESQSLNWRLFCEWSEFAWQLYLQSPNDFPVLPVQSLQSIIRFNFDHNGMAQQISQRLFRLESIDKVYLKNVHDSPEAHHFSLLYSREKLPQVAATEVFWSHASRGKPDIARLIRGEPCFPQKSTYYQETNTLILSARFLINKALLTLLRSTNKLTGATFHEEFPGPPSMGISGDHINDAENNRQLIRLISDKRSAEIYTPVICNDLKRLRVLIVGNFRDRVTIFESSAGQNFDLIGSGIFSPGIALDCRESLGTIKRLLNEHDATILSRY
ncbi:AAA family ATPase [Endozoicomonas sp. GU-1]|uniref:AAA family ATPase n=1 Tax=Endozoicomonas sp. GU-1 TaxID=3009078 RepID=UPI0022B596AD|nr:AAA family ATPase [Endozoicomonas sp. GU-1]WBA81029.1 AAA family ATPase [Endozoicomonas sp. GU-1]